MAALQASSSKICLAPAPQVFDWFLPKKATVAVVVVVGVVVVGVGTAVVLARCTYWTFNFSTSSLRVEIAVIELFKSFTSSFQLSSLAYFLASSSSLACFSRAVCTTSRAFLATSNALLATSNFSWLASNATGPRGAFARAVV